MVECTKCGYKWESLVISPVACPRCKRRDWDGIHDANGRLLVVRSVTRRECFRCGYYWQPRRMGVTKECPRCKRRDWQADQSDPAIKNCWYCMGSGCPMCKKMAVTPQPLITMVVPCKRCHGELVGGCGVCGGEIRCNVCSDTGNGPDGHCPACGLSPV